MNFKDALEIAISALRGVRVPSLGRRVTLYDGDQAAKVLQEGYDALTKLEEEQPPSLFSESRIYE